ncbi:MAG: hypothetical protein AAGH81_00435 [Bacteroidota bacterium]
MVSYLKFLLKSTNHHGVHSPFVFNYLTNGLYTKPNLSKDKTEDILLKSISYFGYKNIQIEHNPLKTRIGNQQTGLNYGVLPLDALVIKDFSLAVVLEMMATGKVHNNTLFVIQNLRNNWHEWNKAISHPKITVSIDAYSIGLLFNRKEQVKEHFIIRL